MINRFKRPRGLRRGWDPIYDRCGIGGVGVVWNHVGTEALGAAMQRLTRSAACGVFDAPGKRPFGRAADRLM
jgi:hypothetical protein